MIVDIGNMLIYLPMTSGYDSLLTKYMDAETAAFINCLENDKATDIFVIVAPQQLRQVDRKVRKIITSWAFTYDRGSLGAGYWIKEA